MSWDEAHRWWVAPVNVAEKGVTVPSMSEDSITTDDPASEPVDADIEHRAMELAKADGFVWAAAGTPEQGADGQSGAASNEDREHDRKLARNHLGAKHELIVE